jgi:hypothetical protein
MIWLVPQEEGAGRKLGETDGCPIERARLRWQPDSTPEEDSLTSNPGEYEG